MRALGSWEIIVKNNGSDVLKLIFEQERFKKKK
jgi:hypothetical protein